MQTIFKYALEVTGAQRIELPRGASILTVATQGAEERVFLWAMVDPDAPAEQRRIFLRGTGHDCSGVGRYIATFQQQGGRLVWHAFEEINTRKAQVARSLT